MSYVYRCLILLLLLASPLAYAQSGQTEGINDSYKSPRLRVEEWVGRLEVEGREAYDLRKQIIDAVRLKEGQSVADVGAGTGLFIPLLADEVGARGVVYAIDIAPRFVEHIKKKAALAKLSQVKTVLSNERSIALPANSVDVVFACDAYHHFVYYEDMLASIRSALKPNGELIIVDFDIASKTLPSSMIEHVGKPKEEFRRQIEEAGFRLADDLTLPTMRTNFMYRFVKTREH
jgi:cyclopropane fatty-acyl-phospholipid synthase-like methyltransferase